MRGAHYRPSVGRAAEMGCVPDLQLRPGRLGRDREGESRVVWVELGRRGGKRLERWSRTDCSTDNHTLARQRCRAYEDGRGDRNGRRRDCEGQGAELDGMGQMSDGGEACAI